MEPLYLTLAQVLDLHETSLRLYGGMPGIREPGGLESAISQAEASFGGVDLHPTLFDKAAAYLFHLAKNHPFLDGNKRTAAAAAVTFLSVNGYDLPAELDDGPLYDLTIRTVTGQSDKTEIAKFFRRHGVEAPPV